ncbi:phosphatidylglycerol:prolipoprotein diacylglycerol transferase [Natranaerovirga pectinivora]|uniref:Phosphatidylglycerol--prolipoprotein diacylglyceryl transferase n=1 Tax=Natranaerovirga pectinivora TaxID=682400 RepID=A0A4R3MNK0_9FIRM|nr:prolipoprotein diacylglyceryl transferase [Natranaerovirga pectinivora]TCT16845.1 phosphatidylglycerol:prolipoprotein diacylglycerol transferase [Natranaerovirga pectinivora]
MNASDIIFPHLGIDIKNLNPQVFDLFGVTVYWYGLIIAMGILAGLLIAQNEAKRTNQDPNIYIDFLMYALIASVIGARLYYVIFSWEEYRHNLSKIFSLREGGLAIYGVIIASIITLVIYTKKKKLSFFVLADTASLGLLAGQAIGRWGNFVNREAFGGYTESLFAMMIKKSDVNYIPLELMDTIKIIDGVEYLQVQPTFLYESLWNIGLLLFLLYWRKKKKFTGEIFAFYILGYALGRFWIEGLRTDQLLIYGTAIPISQVIALISATLALVFIVFMRKKSYNT